MEQKLITKIGLHTLPRLMTRKQAQRYGERHQDKALKAAGFMIIVAETDLEMHGWHGYRINCGK